MFSEDKNNIKSFACGEIVVTAGDPRKAIYILLKGEANQITRVGFHRDLKLKVLSEGSVCGEETFLYGTSQSVTVVAKTDCLFAVITKKDLDRKTALIDRVRQRLLLQGYKESMRQESIEKNFQTKEIHNSVQEPEAHSEVKQAELNLEFGKLDNNSTSFPQEINSFTINLAGELFPPEHPRMNIDEPEAYAKYVFAKKEICPVCHSTIEVKLQRNSKLKLKGIDRDLRQRFIDFEPSWYLVWVCPECFYANYYFDFVKIANLRKPLIRECNLIIENKSRAVFSEPRQIEQVFAAYYLMLKQTIALEKTDEDGKKAEIWMRLGWLYEDGGYNNQAKVAYSYALEHYLSHHLNSTVNKFKPEQEQKFFLRIAELLCLFARETEALDFFRKVSLNREGVQKLAEQAYGRIQEIKSALKSKTKET